MNERMSSKLMKSLVMIIMLYSCNVIAQSQEVERSIKNQGETLSIHWQPGIDYRTLIKASHSLLEKYPEKIISAIIDNRTKVMNVVYKSTILTNEDLLQVIQMEGIINPYFILNQRKYFLDASGSIVFDFIK